MGLRFQVSQRASGAGFDLESGHHRAETLSPANRQTSSLELLIKLLQMYNGERSDVRAALCASPAAPLRREETCGGSFKQPGGPRTDRLWNKVSHRAVTAPLNRTLVFVVDFMIIYWVLGTLSI